MDEINSRTEAMGSINELRLATDNELGAIRMLIRDQASHTAARRLSELGERLQREARYLTSAANFIDPLTMSVEETADWQA